jgi:hypothetical protein
VKDERFPWTQVGPGPEPRLRSGFASRVIEKSRTTRARKRRAKAGAGLTAGFAAIIAMFFWTHSMPLNQRVSAHDSRLAASPVTFNDFDSDAWSDDLVTVLMPNARQAAKFDSYYGTAAWDSYASWDPDSYDASRTR